MPCFYVRPETAGLIAMSICAKRGLMSGGACGKLCRIQPCVAARPPFVRNLENFTSAAAPLRVCLHTHPLSRFSLRLSRAPDENAEEGFPFSAFVGPEGAGHISRPREECRKPQQSKECDIHELV